ncbi:probable dolichyl pyrophosphate Man9GlcNAc2 alpha-1,3-glucosyltransferase [Galendromus occidentalis]|uniref:Alpha-1,3-glucosyltransferase n=1 Tax=Galendromus occidentalis TaxID=34638 RepID=A0AAJ6QWD4_9ACAR|nr:probable dolichyl pyrophosphate Man9GlcNAc2 alpha-1,3-glucosyltransferase [Galendromus occidentalis]
MMFDASLMTAVMWGLILRLSTMTFPHSGQSKPPMYGDYEAQRHWMAVTTELPMKEWYVQTPRNDLQYWGLDYPPLTAYHSWLCGKISASLNPSWTKLNSSRGHESHEHKRFMRYSVLVSEILTFLPAVLYYASGSSSVIEKDITVWVFLMNPVLILIDHAHFQYNSVCLGLFVAFVALVKNERYIPAAIAFSLALNFKHIALYYAVPVFLHMLKACVSPPHITRFMSISLAVVATFGILWAPFLINGTALNVIQRIFPFNRGIYEDKVSNFWYVGSLVLKFKKVFSQERLVQFSLLSTFFASLPSWFMLLCRTDNPHHKMMNFKFALFNTSMAFYLFSYMVHEKSILFPLTALLLVTAQNPEFVWYFTGVASFSLVPLLQKDGVLPAYFALVLQSFFIIYKSHIENLSNRRWNQYYLLRILMSASLLVALLLHAIEFLFMPPKRFPHLFVALNCIFCFVHFLFSYLYGHVLQWRYSFGVADEKTE